MTAAQKKSRWRSKREALQGLAQDFSLLGRLIERVISVDAGADFHIRVHQFSSPIIRDLPDLALVTSSSSGESACSKNGLFITETNLRP